MPNSTGAGRAGAELAQQLLERGTAARQALVLSRALRAVQREAEGGEKDASKLVAVALRILQERNLRRKWITAVLSIPDTLEDVDYVGDGALVAIAERIGTTRLIDNLLL